MPKPLHERSYGWRCVTNHGKRYDELLKATAWSDGEIERCCFTQPLRLYKQMVCIILVCFSMFSYVSDMNPGAPKRPRVHSSDQRSCCQNLLRHNLWKAETVLEKQLSHVFLILPDEMSDNPSDSVGIAKNCQKWPRAARDPNHPRSGALQSCVKSWNIYVIGVVQPGLETYHWIRLWSNNPKKWKESAETEGARRATVKKSSCSEGNSFRTLKKNSRQQTADHEVPLLFMWRWIGMDLQINTHCLTCYKTIQNHVKRYSELPKNDSFCSEPPLWTLVLALAHLVNWWTCWQIARSGFESRTWNLPFSIPSWHLLTFRDPSSLQTLDRVKRSTQGGSASHRAPAEGTSGRQRP